MILSSSYVCIYGELAARGDFEEDFTPQIPKRKMKQKNIFFTVSCKIAK